VAIRSVDDPAQAVGVIGISQSQISRENGDR
jgi:hypothetical protein